MQLAGAQELAYANTALINALMDALVAKGVLSIAELRAIADDAVEAMKPTQNIGSVAGAIRYIEQAIVPQINERMSR